VINNVSSIRYIEEMPGAERLSGRSGLIGLVRDLKAVPTVWDGLRLNAD
jgi:hypothetical protein